MVRGGARPDRHTDLAVLARNPWVKNECFSSCEYLESFLAQWVNAMRRAVDESIGVILSADA